MGAVAASPTRRHAVEAVLLALCCSLAFLRSAVLPTHSVVPFPPEVHEPARSEALAAGRITEDELSRGARSMGDKYNQSLAWDRILQTRLRDGTIPLWTRDIAGGAPFVPQMAQVYQPWNLLLLLPLPSAGIYGIWFLLHQVLFGLFAWWFLRKVGLSQHAALFGMVCAVAGLWMQARVHHNVIVSAALPLFALLSSIHHSFHVGPGPGRSALIALGTGVSWLGGFAPVSLQVSYLCIAYAGFCAWRTRRFEALWWVGGGMALGGVLSLAQMGPTLVAAAITARQAATPDELVRYGAGWPHLLTSVWPDLLNWPTRSTPTWAALDWLPPANARNCNWPETAFAIGLPGLLLALCALRRARPLALFFAAVAGLAFALATASTPFLELSALIPGARAGDLKRFLFLTAIGLSVVAACGAQWSAERSRARPLAVLALVAAAVSAIALSRVASFGDDLDAFQRSYAERFAGVYDGTVVTVEDALAVMRRDDAEANLAMQLWTYGRQTALALGCAAVALWVHRCARVLALAALTLVELAVAGHGTIVPVGVERVTTPPRLLQPVLDATGAAAADDGVRPRLCRLVEADAPRASEPLPPNLGAFFGVEDLCAYNPLPPRRMEELFLAIEPDAPPDVVPGAATPKTSVVFGGTGVGGFRDPRSLTHPMLDLLGVRFVLSARDDLTTGSDLIDRTPDAAPRPFRLYERTTTWPRATFVDTSELVSDRRERLTRVGERSRDPRRLVLLEDERAPVASGDGVGDATVDVVAHEDQRVVVRVHNEEPGYLRLADPWDPGWTATVDGDPAEIFVADHYLRAVYLPPGRHEVSFEYDGATVWSFRWASAAALLAIVVLLVVGRRRRTAARADR